jgi:hypothetical protein
VKNERPQALRPGAAASDSGDDHLAVALPSKSRSLETRLRRLEMWATRGQDATLHRPSPGPASGSIDPKSVSLTDEAVIAAVCYTRKSLAHFLGISTRTFDRLAGQGLFPAPDLVIGSSARGSSARWAPTTIARWLASKPRLPGRKGGAR